MAILSINNAIDGLTEGSTVNVGAAGGVLATDTDPFGAALAVSAVGFNNQTTNVTAGTAVIAGSYGTLTMRANGSYSYSALNNISLPAIGFVQDHFTIAVTDAQGNAGQATLTITVTQAGVQYVAAAAGATVTIGNAATVVDASLGNVTVKGGNGNDVVIGGANDTITLGNGNDTVLAGTNDTIKVGNGNDTVVGGANDAITLGNGNDTVAGGSGDSVTAGNGNDAIAVGANSAVTAGNGNDTVTAGNNSSVKAGNGTDTITAGNNSTVAAGNGNDAITAGSNSTVAAGNGTDTITAGAGSTVSAGNHAAIAPTLSIPTTLTVNEDGSIAVPITVSVGSTSETVTVRISGIPSDATLRNSSGPLTVTNGSITLTKAQLAGLTLTAGEVTSVTLTVTATGVFGADSATVNGTIALTVNPVAPTLSIANQILSVNEDGTVALGIVETPFDPRDVVSLTIAGVPSDATLSAGINNGNGTWTLTPAQLAGLALRAGEETTATLTITATNTQGATAAISKTIALTVNPVAEAPILTIPGGKFSFAAPVSYAAGSGPEDLAVDTINGAAAVVTSNIQGGTISLLQGDGAGHLGSPASFASGGSSPNALVLGDFNQDGVADVAVVNQDGGGASVLLGNADGTFGSPTELANSSSNPNSLATGDFNGDGKLDLLLGESVGSQLLYYQGNGNGTFQSPVALASGQQVAGIAVGDVNHDGKSDILAFVGTGNPGAAQILEILSNGNGTFGAPNVLASLPGTEGSLALADLQGNGVLDLIAAPVNSRGIVVMKGDGDGGFGPPVTYGTVNPTNDREAMVVGDFNGDGKLDVAVVNAGMGVAFFAGNGDGTFQPEADISVPGATALAAGDLNGDGHPDLVVSNTAGNVVDVLISQPTSAEATTEDTPLTIDGIMLAAVDADDALSMNLSVVHGALTLGSTAGLTITSDGTNGTLAFSGSQASISAALAGGVTYTPAGAFTGTDTLTVVGTATEGASSASSTQTIALTVTSGAQTLSVSILGDAQENATLTALASDTDANATIAYQWQRSTDGGSTWTPIDGANQANYVVQEGDEGDLIDVVATGTDSHTNQSATATSAQTAPVIDAPPILTPSFRFAADNLSINKNGTLIFNDTFAQAPPFAPSVTEQGTTTPVSFQTTSAFADDGTQAIMAPSGADTFEVALFDAQLLTNNDPTSELGLKQDSDFTVSATFDLTLPPPSSLLGVGFGHYGISLTDATATSTPDQVINFWVQNFNSATPTVTLQQSDPADGIFNDLADVNLTAGQFTGNDQIAFHLSHVAGSTAITGSFDLIHDGTITSTTTLSGSTQLGTLFTNGVDWTQASINAFVAANVLVSGLPRVNSTLTASVTTNDADATIRYEWQSSSDGGTTWNSIAGAADSATYVLQASDVNDKIRVIATTSDPDNAASATSASDATATVAPAPSLALAISVIGNAPVQEGQQLVASATIFNDDPNAAVSYQWQSSGNGGLTWDNVTGATTGTAAGVTSSFYQLTEADEGKVFRAEASFTDVATGQPVSTTSAPTVAVADVTPVITIPFSFAADELSIVKNGSQIYDDTFAVAPPDSPTILSNGVPTAINYIMTGGTWTDVGGKAIMSSSGVALVPGTTTADITARLNTNTNPASTLGLKLGATFTASAKFDLTALPKGAYGITLTDASATQQADQVVRLLVQGFANGNTVVELEQAPLNGTPVILASQTLTADQLAGNNQIELDLSHLGGATAITGSFELIDQGTVTGTTTLAPTGTIFTGGITFTRAELDGFVAADSVLITGTPQEGQTLTALAAANDADATLHYAWQSSSDGGTTWNPIAGAADSANYIVQESDENNIIRVVATATDPDNNVTATAISAATAPVQDAPGAPEPPTLWGSFTFPAQPTDGTHFSGFSSFGRPAGANAIPFTFGATPTPFNPNGPDEITQNFLAFDPFMLPSTQGAQPLQTVDVAQFPYRAAMVYADTSPTTTEAITFYESQDQGDNTSIMQDVITGGLDPNGLLSVGTPTPIETGLTGTLYNLVAADRTPNNILSSYAIAWDTLNAAGTYDVQFQAFNADGRASSPIVTLLGQGEAPGSAITATPAWQFRGGGGAYIEALASHDPVANQDFLQFTGFGLDGNTDGQSFVVTPDLDAYAAGATNHITQEVAPGSTRPLTEIQFTQFGLGNATNRYAIAWNETVVDAAGTHDQVEFAIYDPTSNSVVSHSTFQIADGNAQNIQVATFNNGGQTVAALVYGDNVATNLIEFDQNGDKLGAVTDNTPAIAGPTEIFGDGRVGLSFNETLDAGGTSQIVTHVYDLRTTGVNINDANLANGTDQYVAGTQFNDVFGGENGVDNTYYYVGRDAANGPAPTDSFTGGAGGWNVAIMPDAASNYTIADNPNGSVTLTNTGDPAHAGSLILNNVQAIAFAPTQDPSGDTGSLAATGNELLVLGPLPNGGEAIAIDLGTTLGLNTANAGDIQFAGSSGMLLLGPQASVTGTVLGFTGQDQLDFAGITAGASASLLFTPNNGGGVLSVSDGTTTASLVLAGDFTPSSFTAASDGHGGTLARLVSPS